ncbi:MAG: electron transfer flavoprotein [Verrucomicrobiales bacterium]|nr:electron transfer flavoprotein [Verrucomicrobiales bacterium]
MNPTSAIPCDVLIIGGALSGAATATLILEKNPTLSVYIVEKNPHFSRRVGEATVEISTYFLTHSLGLTDFLNETQLVKNGLRFWFFNKETHSLPECSEIGGKYLSRVPAFLVDRAVLDEEVLSRAVKAGARLLRPAQVKNVSLNPGSLQEVEVEQEGVVRTFQPRWVVDASGVAAMLARKNRWWKSNDRHPTTAVWSRWKNVKSFNDPALATKYPEWAKKCFGIRGTATNHLMGEGWWAWWIALKGGDVSIGITFDQRIVDWPEEGSVGDRLKTFLCQHPVARELLADASYTPGDIHLRKNLPYYSEQIIGDGFSLVGDAAGFIDPFYSPGMDWISFTATITANLIAAERAGMDVTQKITMANASLVKSYHRWFEGIYLNKYFYFGHYDLTKVAFLLDLGFYYQGVANQPFMRGEPALLESVFSTKPSVPFFHLMRFYNRRLAAMGRRRLEEKSPAPANKGKCFMFGGFTFKRSDVSPIVKALFLWLGLELSEGWKTWFRSSAESQTPMVPAAVDQSML